MKAYLLFGLGLGLILSGIGLTAYETYFKQSAIVQKIKKPVDEKKISQTKEKSENKVDKKEAPEKKVEAKKDIVKKITKELDDDLKNVIKDEPIKKAVIKKEPEKIIEKKEYRLLLRTASRYSECKLYQNLTAAYLDTIIIYDKKYYRLVSNKNFTEENATLLSSEIKKEFKLNPKIRLEKDIKDLKNLVKGPVTQKELDELLIKTITKDQKNENKKKIIPKKTTQKKVEQKPETNTIKNDNKKANKKEENPKEKRYKIVFLKSKDIAKINRLRTEINEIVKTVIIKSNDDYQLISSKDFDKNMADDISKKISNNFNTNAYLSEIK